MGRGILQTVMVTISHLGRFHGLFSLFLGLYCYKLLQIFQFFIVSFSRFTKFLAAPTSSRDFIIHEWNTMSYTDLFSDMFKFHFEIEKLQEIVLSNGYSNKFIDTCISKFMNKLYIKKPVMLTVPKKQLCLLLPFMGKTSALVNSGLARSLHTRLPFCKVKIVFKTSNRLKNYYSFKDVVPEPLCSCQIYNFTCRICNASYIGKTFRYMKVRVSEHHGVSPWTSKHLKGTLSTSVRDHLLDCNRMVAWDDLKVLGRESQVCKHHNLGHGGSKEKE